MMSPVKAFSFSSMSKLVMCSVRKKEITEISLLNGNKKTLQKGRPAHIHATKYDFHVYQSLSPEPHCQRHPGCL